MVNIVDLRVRLDYKAAHRVQGDRVVGLNLLPNGTFLPTQVGHGSRRSSLRDLWSLDQYRTESFDAPRRGDEPVVTLVIARHISYTDGSVSLSFLGALPEEGYHGGDAGVVGAEGAVGWGVTKDRG